MKSEADARKQDFMALFQKVQATENDIQSNKLSLEIALENIKKSLTGKWLYLEFILCLFRPESAWWMLVQLEGATVPESVT